MAYEKMHDIFDLAVRMQSSAEGVSIIDIMRQFNVSRRTAERMRNFIRERFPELSESIGEHGTKYWHLPYGCLKNYINFSSDELSSLQNAQQLLNHFQLSYQSQVINNVLEKIKALMRPELCRKIESDIELMQASESYSFHPAPLNRLKIQDTVVLRHAIMACKKIILSYQDKHQKKTLYLCPYAFVYGYKHFLVAYNEQNQQYQNIYLDNITNVKETKNYFTRNKNFHLYDYCWLNPEPYQQHTFKTKWRFDAQTAPEAKKTIFHPAQILKEQKDGSLIVCFEVGDILEMDYYLYKWGTHVKVIKPKRWKSLVKKAKNNLN